MESDIPDTSTDSSSDSDTIILSNHDKSNENDTPQSSKNSKTESELDSLFKKYLGDDYLSKKDSNLSIVDKDFLEYTPIKNRIPSYDLDELPDNWNLPSCSTARTSKTTNSIIPHTVISTESQSVSSSDENELVPDYVDDELPDDWNLPSCSTASTSKTTNIITSHTEIPTKSQSASSSDENELVPGYVDALGKKRRNKTNQEQKKIEKEKLKKQKLEEKEQKKEEERKNKAMKDALASHYKNLKPENCLKFIKVHIDVEITKKEYSEEVINALQSNGVSFTVESQIISSIITWTRQIGSHILDTNGELINTSKGLKNDEVLVIIECIDFVNHIHNKTFLTYIENLYGVLKGKKIILVIYGLDKYYKFHKNKRNQEFAEEISGRNYKSIKDQKLFSKIPKVSRRTVEYALTEIQLLHSMSHRMIETKHDMGLLVFQMTKSIAQIPYKLQQQEKFKKSKWFMSEDNKNCIRVDKNGNGLARLWKQMITTFPLATLETAEAITSKYSTPLNLMKAYEEASTEGEGEKLLQDILIRRAAGPISTMRKIGPELSKKIYNLFTSFDPHKVV